MLHSRTYLLPGLLALVAACEVGEGDSVAANSFSVDGGAAYRAAVVPEGSALVWDEGTLELTANRHQNITVELVDPEGEPLPDIQVRFAIEGEGGGGGSSLSTLSDKTDERGLATVELTAGDMSSEFEVRASVPGVAPLFISVEVTKVERTTLEVSFGYEGTRGIAQFQVRAYRDASCEELHEAPAGTTPVSEVEAEGDRTSAMLELDASEPPDVLRVVARGPQANVVATACTPLPPLDMAQATLKVSLVDTALRLAGTYPLLSELDVTASAERLSEALRDSLEQTAPEPASENAERLLKAVQDVLAEAGRSNDASWVADQAYTLTPELTQTLADAERGLSHAITRLADTVRSDAAHLSVTGQLTAGGTAMLELSYRPVELTAVAPNGDLLRLRFGTDHDQLGVPGSIVGNFDTKMSQLRIDALRITLGLGEYGDALVYGLAEGPDGSQREQLLTATGCAELTAWAAGQEGLHDRCDDNCLQDACALALDDMLSDTTAELEALDASHPGLALRGDLPIYDITGDGTAKHVDEASVTGSWGRAESAMEPDLVRGTLAGAPTSTL